jgi:3-methyl-2-oxobutanoate hydroxymethyltransferase
MSKSTVPSFRARKKRLGGEPLVVLTAYDAATTAVGEAGGVDALLVGDSWAWWCWVREHASPSLSRTSCTTRVRWAGSPEAAAHRGHALALVSPLPGGRGAERRALRARGGGRRREDRGRAGTACPSCTRPPRRRDPGDGAPGPDPPVRPAHGGLPRAGPGRGGGDRSCSRIARALEEAGAFSLVLEGIPVPSPPPSPDEIGIPTIGIGAGPTATARCWWCTTCWDAPRRRPQVRAPLRHRLRAQTEAVPALGRGRARRRFPSEDEVYG